MKCTYGKTYKMDCNTCRCGHDYSLLCTKAVCLHRMTSELGTGNKNRSKIEEEEIDRKRKRKVVRRGNRKQLMESGIYPPLPLKKSCVPGRYYQEECRRCYCKTNRQPICSMINVCDIPTFSRAMKPEEVRPPVKDKEFKNLPELPHTAAPCTPGTTYRVDCNVCVCDEYMNLMCDKLLCISFFDMHKAEALKRSGMPCNIDHGQENEILQSKCVKCLCNETTYCEAVDNCISEAELTLRSNGARRNGSRLTFDYNTQKCDPDHIYKDNCNKCYCQKDLTLRCTQKTCLNYNQAISLEQQQHYLQEQGL